MIERKFSVAIVRFAYAGNGGFAAELPEIGNWLVSTVLAMKAEVRILDIHEFLENDTPIPMSRNHAVQRAKNLGADFLLMLDSDTLPDYELKKGEKSARPFWETSFRYAVEHWDDGPTVVAAPYCGPPPHENVYTFLWRNFESSSPNPNFKLDQFTREEASYRTGIEPVAATATGLILIDMRVFSLLKHPYFYYEWTDETQSEKASTEDVVFTRDCSLAGATVCINWWAWAGHMKPKCVGMPRPLTIDSVREQLREAIVRGHKTGEKLMMVSSDGKRPETMRGVPEDSAQAVLRR